MSPQKSQRPPGTLYRYLTPDELDRCARRAEHFMNRGLEQRRWKAVVHHRSEMLAVEAERQRRDGTADSSSRIVIRQVW
jgi:hypothetical protein